MALFSKDTLTNYHPPGPAADTGEHLHDLVPDVGKFFDGWINSFFTLDEGLQIRLTHQLDSLRTPAGWITTQALDGYFDQSKKGTIFTHLSHMVTLGEISVGVWGSADLSRKDTAIVRDGVKQIVGNHGHGSAAVWAASLRPGSRFHYEVLSGLMVDFWRQSVEIYNDNQYSRKDLRRQMDNWVSRPEDLKDWPAPSGH